MTAGGVITRTPHLAFAVRFAVRRGATTGEETKPPTPHPRNRARTLGFEDGGLVSGESRETEGGRRLGKKQKPPPTPHPRNGARTLGFEDGGLVRYGSGVAEKRVPPPSKPSAFARFRGWCGGRTGQSTHLPRKRARTARFRGRWVVGVENKCLPRKRAYARFRVSW